MKGGHHFERDLSGGDRSQYGAFGSARRAGADFGSAASASRMKSLKLR